jgi:hypothetical protein
MKNFIYVIGLGLFILATGCKKETKSYLPIITTDSISNVSTFSATCFATVTSDNGELVTDRGVCWGTTVTPTIANSKISNGSGIGKFAGNLTGLSPALRYYVRGYATNSAGTSYGVALTIFTKGKLPVVASATATEIDSVSAVLNGTVNANFLPTRVIFEYGTELFYGDTISATPNYVYGDSTIAVAGRIQGLLKGRLYHFRIRADNELGANFSNDNTLSTLGK